MVAAAHQGLHRSTGVLEGFYLHHTRQRQEDLLLDREVWLQGRSIQDLAPTLSSIVDRRFFHSATVAAALLNRSWLRHITGGLIAPAIQAYLAIWDHVRDIHLSDVEDTLIWRWSADMKYSSRSAYRAARTHASVARESRKLGHRTVSSDSSGLRCDKGIGQQTGDCAMGSMLQNTAACATKSRKPLIIS